MTEPLKESVGASAVHAASAATPGAPTEQYVVACPRCGTYHFTMTLSGRAALHLPCRNSRCGKGFNVRRDSTRS